MGPGEGKGYGGEQRVAIVGNPKKSVSMSGSATPCKVSLPATLAAFVRLFMLEANPYCEIKACLIRKTYLVVDR